MSAECLWVSDCCDKTTFEDSGKLWLTFFLYYVTDILLTNWLVEKLISTFINNEKIHELCIHPGSCWCLVEGENGCCTACLKQHLSCKFIHDLVRPQRNKQNILMTWPDYSFTSCKRRRNLKGLYTVLNKGRNNTIYKEKRVLSGKAKGRIEQRNKRHASVEKLLIMILYSSPSENAQLLKMKAVRPPAEQRPRSPKAKPVSETSAPGSTTH